MASPWRYALEYRAVAAVAAAVRALPQWASLALGSAIGWVFYLVDAPHRRLTRRQPVGRLSAQAAAARSAPSPAACSRTSARC